jgi:hypothetical protein
MVVAYGNWPEDVVTIIAREFVAGVEDVETFNLERRTFGRADQQRTFRYESSSAYVCRWGLSDMNPDLIFDIYRKVREARDRELQHIMDTLRPKAATDPEIREALRILESWSRTNSTTSEDQSDSDVAK